MTALVTKHLPLVAGAPDGIKKLRALILELAVRGRLLPSARQPNSDVPVGWLQTKLGSILSFEYGDNLPAAKRSNTGEYPVYGSNGVVGTHNVSFVQHPCIVIGRKGSAGALNLCTSPGCCVTDVAYYCVPPQSMSLEYTFKLLHTLGLDNLGKGIKPGLNRNEAYALDVLIPPLPEQRRIVAKVDELMALCDRLESDQADAEAAHAQLVQALLDSLTQATDAADFRACWQRLSEHFHTLFTTEASIDALKQTVLQLAVMGKLVKQHPEDEWASELLKRVAREKARLLEEGGSRKQKSSAKFADDERPFDLPHGWAWVRLGDYCQTQTGTTPNKSQHELFGSHMPFIKPGDIYPDWVKYDGEGLSAMGVSQNGRIARGGSLLMVCIGTIGKCNLIDRDCSFNQQINSATLYEGLPKYLLIALRSRYFQDQAWGSSSSTTIAILNKGKWESIPIPLPGITEQHRIVAKVDELMALCDQLKAQLSEARKHHEQLAQALVEQAIS